MASRKPETLYAASISEDGTEVIWTCRACGYSRTETRGPAGIQRMTWHWNGHIRLHPAHRNGSHS